MSAGDSPTIETKHLEMIQGVINRLAGNSFSAKGWSITLVAGLIALSKAESFGFALLALLPALCFWGLDAYYLRQERLFRELYNAVRHHLIGKEGSAAIERYSMNTEPFEKKVDDRGSTLFAGVVVAVHAPVVVSVIAVCWFAAMK